MAKITGITTGKIVDFGIKDSMNMGAAMAPAAKEVIRQHFEDFGRSEKEYDRIITGDRIVELKFLMLRARIPGQVVPDADVQQ